MSNLVILKQKKRTHFNYVKRNKNIQFNRRDTDDV